MGLQNAPIKQKSCFKCGFRGETVETLCPQCNRRLETATSVRIRGFLLVVCGVFLMGTIGYISIWMLGVLNSPTANGAKFTGSNEQLMMIFALLGALILFGFVSLLTGIWQLILGWRNKVFTWSVIGLGALLFTGGYFILWKFKG